MHAQLLVVLLFACQIILNESSVIHEHGNSIISITPVPTKPATLPESYVSIPDDRVLFACQVIGDTSSVVHENRNSATLPEGHIRLSNGHAMFACQIIRNGSFVVHENVNSATTETSATTRPAVLPDGYVAFPDVHAAYKIHKESKSWNTARDLCIAEGAQLAIADTVEKIQHIYGMLSLVYDWVSVGIQLSEATNEWVRIDNGLPLTSLPWQQYNPDKNGKCVAITYSGDSLVNLECDVLRIWYACEIPI